MINSQAKILVVDDEESNVKLLEAYLAPRGYTIIKAFNGKEALEQVQLTPPDLILLDIMMPIIDGFEVCKILKNSADTCLIPIVILTALGEVEDRIRGIEAGADDFLTKPFNKDELMARIRTSLRQKQEIDQRLDGALRGELQNSSSSVTHIFRREGEYWTLKYQGTLRLLKDVKGLHYIALLLRHPGREFHVLDLVNIADGQPESSPPHALASLSEEQMKEYSLSVGYLGDAGTLTDKKAQQAYRERLEDLQDQLEEAQRFNDPGRTAKLQEEIGFLIDELTAARGLGGRDSKAASVAERARLSTTKAIKAALRKIGDNHSSLGHHLTLSVRTGTYCSYEPDSIHSMNWDL